MRIAIVGCGYAGAGLLCSLLRSPFASRLTIDVYDGRASRGSGRAYEDDLPSNLVNRPASLMSLAAPGDFARWLASRPGGYRPYPPRSAFGQFIEATVAAAAARAPVPPRFIGEAVVGLEPAAGACRVRTVDGLVGDYETIVLATGPWPPDDVYGLAGRDRYLPTAYPTGRLGVVRNATVGVIGAKLSAVDAAIALLDGDPGNRVVLLSRRTGLPHACPPYRHVPLVHLNPAGVAAALERAGPSLAAAAALFEREFQAHGLDITLRRLLRRRDWLSDPALVTGVYSVLASTNRAVPEIWRALPEADRVRFRRAWERPWSYVRVPVPPVNRARIDHALADGRLVHLTGLRAIEPAGGRFRIEAGDRVVEADWIVNASGFGRRPQGPLYDGLTRSGLARSHPHGGIEIAFDTCEVQGSAPGGRLFAIGHPTVGTYFAVSNIDVIQVQIRRIASAIELALTGRSPARLAVPA